VPQIACDLVTVGIPGTTAAVGLAAPLRLLTVQRRDHQIGEQHLVLKPAAGVCHNDEWDREGDDKLVSTGTDADLIQFIRIGFAASGACGACSARDPVTGTGLP
jgi:hypothetical protein